MKTINVQLFQEEMESLIKGKEIDMLSLEEEEIVIKVKGVKQ